MSYWVSCNLTFYNAKCHMVFSISYLVSNTLVCFRCKCYIVISFSSIFFFPFSSMEALEGALKVVECYVLMSHLCQKFLFSVTSSVSSSSISDWVFMYVSFELKQLCHFNALVLRRFVFDFFSFCRG